MRTSLLAALLAVPSAVYLWINSDLPQFCQFHDDCIYFVSAKSLAEGQGYAIASLPGTPAQTKHPPLYSGLLAIAWKVVPEFPRNLTVAAWISWLVFPPLLMLLSAYLPRMGIDGWRRWLVLVLFAVNPYVIWFSSQLLSELWFMALLFAAMSIIDKRPGVSGLVAGIGYLMRSAGIALLPAALVYLWLRKDRAGAMRFAAGFVPFFAVWTLWAYMHKTATSDPALIYYLDYAAYERINVSLSDIHLYLWKNADGLLLGLGSLILPKVTSALLLKILAQVIGVAAISGIVRMVKAGHARLYALFAAAHAVLLLIWHFPPDERFVLPLFPLVLAGVVVELEHFVGLLKISLRHRDLSQRVVAAGMVAGAALVFGGSLALQGYVALVLQPASAAQAREDRKTERVAFEWLKEHASAQSVLAYADPLVYLYTGRPVLRQSLLPRLWYHEDHPGIIDLWGNLAPFARDHGLGYFYFAERDLNSASEEDRTEILRRHRQDPDMKPVFHAGEVTIYAFADRGNAAYTAPPANTITSPGQVVAGR